MPTNKELSWKNIVTQSAVMAMGIGLGPAVTSLVRNSPKQAGPALSLVTGIGFFSFGAIVRNKEPHSEEPSKKPITYRVLPTFKDLSFIVSYVELTELGSHFLINLLRAKDPTDNLYEVGKDTAIGTAFLILFLMGFAHYRNLQAAAAPAKTESPPQICEDLNIR